MSLRNLLAVAAVVSFIFGLGLLVAPTPFIGVYGVKTDALSIYLARTLAAALLGFAVLNWMGRNLADNQARQIVVTANLVGYALGFIVGLIDQLSGATGSNSLGWSVVAIDLLLATGFAYFRFMVKEAPARPMTRRSRS